MKKILSLILALLFACGGLSLAETAVTPFFSVDITLPEGYSSADEIWYEPTLVYILLESDDESRPMIDIQISYEDMMSGVTFTRGAWDSDLVQNYVAALSYDVETEQYDAYDTRETDAGTVVMIIPEADYTRVLTVWNGYMLTMFASDRMADGSCVPIGEETLDMVMKFLSDMDISAVIVENGK